MPEESEQFSSAWNLSQHLINQISYLLSSASMNFRQGRPQQAYFDTEEIQTLISSYLSSEEEKEMTELGTKICKLNTLCQKLSGIDGERLTDRQKQLLFRKARVAHNEYVRAYRKKINGLLSKYNLLLVAKEDSSRMF